jgi:hypothetical protein
LIFRLWRFSSFIITMNMFILNKQSIVNEDWYSNNNNNKKNKKIISISFFSFFHWLFRFKFHIKSFDIFCFSITNHRCGFLCWWWRSFGLLLLLLFKWCSRYACWWKWFSLFNCLIYFWWMIIGMWSTYFGNQTFTCKTNLNNMKNNMYTDLVSFRIDFFFVESSLNKTESNF